MCKTPAEHFSVIKDPRRGRVMLDLTEIRGIVACGLLARMGNFVDIAEWARYKKDWLRRFLDIKNGIPSHDTLNRVFRLLDPKSFERVFRAWVAETLPAFKHVVIDGKRLRGATAGSGRDPVGQCLAAGIGLAPGQEGVPDKGGARAAVLPLLRALELRGRLVSAALPSGYRRAGSRAWGGLSAGRQGCAVRRDNASANLSVVRR
jgi:hypothetical protein